MTRPNVETEKHCVVLGGLDGAPFVRVLTTMRSELGRLEALVAELGNETSVASTPIHSMGCEVDRDAIVVDHLDKSLTATSLSDYRPAGTNSLCPSGP